MPRNFGKLRLEPVEIPALKMFKLRDDDPDVIISPARTYGKPFDAQNDAWTDVCKMVKTGPNIWFIAVQDNGWILMAEQDPTMISITGYDIWQIEHKGPDTEIRTRKWDGKNVVDWPVPVKEQEPSNGNG
jgi:hypothetical protein